MTFTKAATALALALSFATTAFAQAPDTILKPTDSPCRTARSAATEAREARFARLQLKTFYLKNTPQQNDANEILVALRNTFDPSTKMFLIASKEAIVMQATPEELAAAGKLISDLDTPRKIYRITFTLIDSDAGKRGPAQHYSMIVASGQNTILKQGSKIPIATGFTSSDNPAHPQTQFTYLDVGINLSATLDEVEHGAALKFKVEQSTVGEKQSGIVDKDPSIHQSVINGVSTLTLNKPMTLGSLDIPGTSHHTDIEALIEQVQ